MKTVILWWRTACPFLNDDNTCMIYEKDLQTVPDSLTPMKMWLLKGKRSPSKQWVLPHHLITFGEADECPEPNPIQQPPHLPSYYLFIKVFFLPAVKSDNGFIKFSGNANSDFYGLSFLWISSLYTPKNRFSYGGYGKFCFHLQRICYKITNYFTGFISYRTPPQLVIHRTIKIEQNFIILILISYEFK